MGQVEEDATLKVVATVAAQQIPQQHLQTQHPTGTGAARALAPSSPTPAPLVTRSTPSAGLTETGAQALCLSVATRELRQVQEQQLKNLERNQGRSQERSPPRENQERNQGRSLGRSQGRSQGR